jgi:hypothetical protein
MRCEAMLNGVDDRSVAFVLVRDPVPPRPMTSHHSIGWSLRSALRLATWGSSNNIVKPMALASVDLRVIALATRTTHSQTLLLCTVADSVRNRRTIHSHHSPHTRRVAVASRSGESHTRLER